MQISLTPQRHRFIFVFGLFLLVLGLGWGAFPLSLSLMILAGNWLWEGNFKWKFEQLKSSKIALVLISFYLLHILGMLWSDNYSYALKDIRIKFPLFLLPFLFVSTKPLTEKEWKLILKLFVLSIVTTTLWSMLFYFNILHLKSNDNRELSRFDSHIRLSLKIVFSICISAWWMLQKITALKKFILFAVMAWLLIFLFILSSLNGIIILALLSIIYLFIVLFKMKNSFLKYLFVSSFIGTIVFVVVVVRNEYNSFFIQKEPLYEKLDSWTATNDLYYHETNLATENGYFVWRYNAYPELKRSWNRMSNFKFDSLDKKRMPVKFTLIRYMTSLGLRKDSVSFRKLSQSDIQNIEEGYTNYKLVGTSHFKRRLYETFWEIDDYMKNGIIKGHSLMMRFEYWRTARDVIKKNFIAGVGTGDVQDAFTQQYQENNSQLKLKNDRKRAHNQFIEIFVQLGIVGLLLFILTLILPLFQLKKMHPLYLSFFLIFLFSLAAEDTIETQMGVSIYAFLNSFFIFLVKRPE